MNWRAFALGAAVAAIVSIVVGAVLVVDDAGEPSLGGSVTTVAKRAGGSTTVPPASAETIQGVEPLALDADRLLADPCAVLTSDLRAMLAVVATPRREGDRKCMAGSGGGAVEVELRIEASDPFTASADFQTSYGGAPSPVAELGDISFQIRQGDRMLIVVFSNGMSVWVLVPTLEIDGPLVDALRDALQ